EITDRGYLFWGAGQAGACWQSPEPTCEIYIITIDVMKMKYRALEMDSKTKRLRIA
ncbi:hypothetical protein SO802_014255, partial [Lithocarpus litseifolius]